MKVVLKPFSLFLILLYAQHYSAQISISGIINDYSKITSVSFGLCNDTISVQNSNNFKIGDKILIIQMQGAICDTNNSNNFGDVINIGGAGLYEFSEIRNKTNNNEIILTKSLVNLYNIDGNLQVVSFPNFKTATVNGTLTAKQWDGTTGGILAFEVSDTLILQAEINVDGKGFRGGKSFFGKYPLNSTNCGLTDYSYSNLSLFAGEKGEGIAVIDSLHSKGRGHFANAGGGGNSHNTGGAGGSNSNTGGNGGDESNSCGTRGTGGIPGESFDYINNRNSVIMGGGAGGGHANDSIGGEGGNGGGIIFIKAKTLLGNSNNISSNGMSGKLSYNDGSGGGGAGGSIILEIQRIVTNPNISVKGGKGGDVDNNNMCHGAGGGGSGGYIRSLNNLTTSTYNVSRGSSGLNTNIRSACFGQSNFANTGSDGIFVVVTESIFPSSLGNDTTLCFGDSILLDVTLPTATYIWSDNSTNPTLNVKQAGTYWVEINIQGCTYRDSINISFFSELTYSLGNDTILCNGDSINLALPSFGDFLWNTNSTDSFITVKTSGTYWLDLTVSSCTYRDSIDITFIDPSTDTFLDDDTALCRGDSIKFDFGLIQNQTFLWSDSTTLPVNTIKQSGLYWLEIMQDGCIYRDSINLLIKEVAKVDLGPDTSACEEITINGAIAQTTKSYLWNTGSNDSSITVTRSGIYWLETYLDGCIFRDSIDIIIKPTPEVNLGPDTTLCAGDSISLFQSSFTADYLWNDSSIASSIKVKQPGIYWLNYTVAGCETRDSILVEYFDTLDTSFLPITAEFCEGDQLQFDIPLVNSTYLWQDGSTNNQYIVLDTGLFTVQILNTCGTRKDSVLVIDKCSCEVVTPNSFSPNNDSVNDYFLPDISCEVNNYSLTIYSRWGEKVFESFRPKFSWDGNVKGKKVNEGIYYYVLKWKEFDSSLKTKKSSLILVR